ncbi:hypothetical protein [Gloeomargarita lithophora]|uniref:hypothetical protein n=1 Tax=Gloeomargarita lithophora TaxID=1188228 RepID=UPI0012FE3D97|nr:hypothetical protein [Gloeomargarita lithophora]
MKVALWFESGGWCDVKEVALERDQGEYLFEYKYVKYKYLPKFLFPIARLDADLIMVECDIEKLASGSVYYKGKDSSPEFMFNSLTAMMATLVDYFESGNTIALDEHYHPDWDWNLLDEIRQRHDPHIREGWEGDTWNSVTNR